MAINKVLIEAREVENRRLSRRFRLPWRPFLLSALMAIVLIKAFAPSHPTAAPVAEPPISTKLFQPTKQAIAAALGQPLSEGVFPKSLVLNLDGKAVPVNAKYTIEAEYQALMGKMLQDYKPDYAAFVAMDASTGKVIALISYTREPRNLGNLALRSSFPAASLFKIVTATAALDDHRVTPDTEISFNGAYHTLYRRNVNDTSSNRWTRHLTIREAFAQSVNTVFAKLGLFTVHPDRLRDYAQRYQFNRFIASDMPVQPGQFMISDDNWLVAQVSSGFNRFVTISPIQGAMMAGAAANDGRVMSPYLIESLTTMDGKPFYKTAPEEAGVAMSADTAEQIRSLMRETIASGTSRKSFRSLLRRPSSTEVEMGGKTGSLTGTDPKGRYDWFVGFGRNPDQKIAVAALTINEKNWRVKSSYLAMSFIEKYFKMSHHKH